MYNAISGTLCHKGLDFIRVDNNGVEWEFSVPSRSVDAFGMMGDRVRVVCWLLHREDQLRLFGFPTESERAVFVELMSVDGIGPKQALKILGGIGADDLERALDAEDMARLEAIPGLGKKTAQKLVFSLKGKLPSLGRTNPETQEPHADIIRALAEMGYDRKRAADIIRQIATEGGSSPAKADDRERELFRRAIVELSGS
ncbi:MAG: Holliday junction branch migration protein RuvA [Spirochaetota bacterium]